MATPEITDADIALSDMRKGYSCCGNCAAFIDEECRIGEAQVFWSEKQQGFVTGWPSPEPSHVCLSHIPLPRNQYDS